MAKKINNENQTIKEIWEKHPLSFYIGSMVGVVIVASSILIFYFSNRISDIKDRYEQQIENLKKNHETEIEVVKMKATQEAQKSTYISIDNNSSQGKELEELLKHYSTKNEK